MLIVTGASGNHYLTLINMITSFYRHINNEHSLIVYNLGLENFQWEYLQNTFKKATFRTFVYSKYPDWFDINVEAGQYAWKPAIIYETYTANPGAVITWMDAGNIILDNLIQLENAIRENGAHSATSSGDIERWTYPDTIRYLDCDCLYKDNRNGACIGLDTSNESSVRLLTDFYKCAQIRECIAPTGSSRENHRQDQAVFTILFYKHGFNSHNNYIGYSIHNDVNG